MFVDINTKVYSGMTDTMINENIDDKGKEKERGKGRVKGRDVCPKIGMCSYSAYDLLVSFFWFIIHVSYFPWG